MCSACGLITIYDYTASSASTPLFFSDSQDSTGLWLASCPTLMSFFQEYVILPALHSQQDFAQQRKIVYVLRVDCDLGRGAKWNLVFVHFVTDIDDRDCTASRRPLFRFHERW